MWGYYPLKYMPSYSLNVLAIYSRIEAQIPYDEIGIYDIEWHFHISINSTEDSSPEEFRFRN